MQQQQAAAGVQPRRSRAARRDPLEPKQNKTPFNFFSIDARSKAKTEHPSADQKVAVLCFGHPLLNCMNLFFFLSCSQTPPHLLLPQ